MLNCVQHFLILFIIVRTSVHTLALGHLGRPDWPVRPLLPHTGSHLTRPGQVFRRNRQRLAQRGYQLDQGDCR